MFSFSYDPEACLMVAIATAGPKSDADYEQLTAQIDQLDRQGKAKNKPIAFVIDVDPKSPQPSAQWRRRFAEQRKNFGSPGVYSSIIARSAIARGVITAMNWISPEPPKVRTVAHATLDESVTWIELAQGTRQGVVRRLHAEAVARIPKEARAAG